MGERDVLGIEHVARQLVLFGDFAYTGERLLARVTAKTGAAASSVMSRCSSLGRLGDGRAEGGRRTTVEGEDGSDFLGKGGEGGAGRRAVDDVWLFRLLLRAGEGNDRWLTGDASILG